MIFLLQYLNYLIAQPHSHDLLVFNSYSSVYLTFSSILCIPSRMSKFIRSIRVVKAKPQRIPRANKKPLLGQLAGNSFPIALIKV